MSEKLYANALEEMRVRDLRETFDAALTALTSPMASIPSAEWGGRKDMICPDDEDERLDFNRSGWSAEVIASGPLGVRPEDSIVLTASAAAAIQQVLIELLQAATAAPPAQGIGLAQPAPSVTRYRIEDAPGLDPVTVYVENYEPGKGRMVVTCYASAWTAFWGAMGTEAPLEQFVASCSPEYVADNMVWGAETKKSTRGHADKVAAAVVALFKSQRDAAPEVGIG